MLFQEHNPYVPYVDEVVIWLKDSGIVDKMFRQVLPYRDMKEHVKFEEEKIIAQHILLPIIFLLVGSFLGLVALAGEILRNWKF